MSKLTGSAKDIYDLVNLAIEKNLDGEESPGIGTTMHLLADTLNLEEYRGRSSFLLKQSQLYKIIYLQAKKLVESNKGELGITYISPYLNRLSRYVHGEKFEKQYGKFKGILWDFKQGIEKIPNKKSQKHEFTSLNDIKSLGITGTVNKLSSSRFEPEQCMFETRHSLQFMGILGSKWIVNNTDNFRRFLTGVQVKSGRVRFLMINPKSKSFQLLKTMRGDHLKDNSTILFREMVKDFPCLEARYYDFLPCFRLIFIDNKTLAMSRYKLSQKHYIKSRKGWEAPHLVIEADKGNWSLYEPFRSYYETVWNQSVDINDL